MVPIAGTYAITVANAIPDWTVEYGNSQQTQIQYNNPSLGGTAATLIADGYPTATTITALDGDFSLLLQGGQTSISISQTGQIPAGSESLLFTWGGFVNPMVSIDNDSLTLFPVKTLANGIISGVNISPWAGQTVQLTISEPSGSSYSLFDNFSFSPNPITVTPEPDALTLMSVGGLLFGLYRRFTRKR